MRLKGKIKDPRLRKKRKTDPFFVCQKKLFNCECLGHKNASN